MLLLFFLTELRMRTMRVMINGNAEKNCAGIFVSHPSVVGKAVARGAFWTRSVLKKPKIRVPRIALAGLQLAKMTSAIEIQP